MVQEMDGFYFTDVKPELLERCEEINALLNNAYWAAGRTNSVMRMAMEQSQNYAIIERKVNRVIGFARVITDFSTMYYLCDVYIDEKFRGRGLGKKLIEWIVLYDVKYAKLEGLLKTKDAVNLYKKYGYEECEAICMIQKR